MKEYNTYYNRFKKELANKGYDDMSILENKTEVSGLEWMILHYSIVQIFLDYVKNHPVDNDVYSYTLMIDLINGNWQVSLSNLDKADIDLPDSDYEITSLVGVTDQNVINSYNNLNHEIYHIICDFIMRHTENINIKLTKMVFSMDGLYESIKKNQWIPSLDSSFSIYHENELVVCSM